MTRALRVSSYPTLLYIDGTSVHQLPATGTPLATPNGILDELLAEKQAATATEPPSILATLTGAER